MPTENNADSSTKISSLNTPSILSPIARPVPLQPPPLIPPQPMTSLSHQAVPPPVLSPIQKPKELFQPNQNARVRTNSTETGTVECLPSPKTKQNYRSQIINLFNRPCIRFLSKEPCKNPCTYNHVLPLPEIVYTKMQAFPNELVQYIYQHFIVKNGSTFIPYFPIICQLYGIRKLLKLFSPLVKDCEKYEKFEYFRFVFEGLLRCGLNKRDALLIIIDHCGNCRASDEAILKIIEIDPLHFIDVLSRYAAKLPLSPALVSKLMEQVSCKSDLRQLTQCVSFLEKIGETLAILDKSVLTTFWGTIHSTKNDDLCARIIRILSNVLITE